MQVEVKLCSELTANPKAEVLCLMKETAAEEKKAEQRQVSVNGSQRRENNTFSVSVSFQHLK